MNSFLHRNITLNLFYNNSRNSDTISPLSTIIATYKSLDKKSLNPSKLDNLIHYIFKIIYYKEFQNILTINSKLFLRNVNSKSEEIIQKNINYNIEEIKSLIGKEKEKILNLYNEEFSFLNESFLNYQKNPKKYELLKDNTLIHCIQSYNKYIYHKCSSIQYGNLISINKKKEILYLICIKCKNCFKNNYINLFCNICNKEYFGLIYKKIDVNGIIMNKDIYLATWKNYHCGLINNEIMKCINCKNYFYYNIKTNKLICQNKKCKFTSNPKNIIWTCSKCLKDFTSEVKPFNPYEYKIFKKQLYYIILSKNKAKPKNSIRCLNCKNIINKDIYTFYHNDKCKGELYQGKIFNKNIIICAKCLFVTYYEEYVWTCPICKNKVNIDKNKKDMYIHIDSISNGNKKDLNTIQTQTIRYSRLKRIKNKYKLEKEATSKSENEILTNNIDSIKTDSSLNNKHTNKRFSYYTKIKPIRNLLKIEKEQTTRKNLPNVKSDLNLDKEKESYHSFSKNSSNSSILSNSLQNKDKKTFHSIIMRMKNRMLASQNKKKYINEIEENIKNRNDKIREKRNSTILSRTVNKSTKFFSLWKDNLRKEDNKMDIKNRKIRREFLHNNERGIKSNENENNNTKFICVKKAFTRKNSSKKNDISNKNTEIKSNNKSIDISQRELNGLRNKYKDRKNKNNTNIKTESNIYDKEKTAKIGSFFIRNNRENNKNNLKDNINNFDKINKINRYKRKNIISNNMYNDNDKDKLNRYKFNDFNNNKFTIEKKNNIKNITYDNKNNNIISNKNKNIIENSKINNIKKNENSKIIYNRNKIHNIMNNKMNNKIDYHGNINQKDNIIIKENKSIKKSHLYSKNWQNIINISSPKNEENKNKIKFTIKEEKIERLANNPLSKTSEKLKSLKFDDNEEEYKIKRFPIYHSKSKKDVVIENKENSVSNLIKKNLQEFFDNKDGNQKPSLVKPKTQILNKNISSNLQKVLDEKAEKKKEITNFNELLNAARKKSLVFDDDDDEEEEKKDIINDFNIKKVIQHFARRNSVVRILREIGNEDNYNINNKEEKSENKESNHFVLEGLINHVNLISSPEKIALLEQNSKIPIFSDNDYCYYESIGEGSNANVYLVKDEKTNEEFALKKMVCQDISDLVKIKYKLEIINSLNHDSIMKVKKIQYKCLDFTTYAINTVMDKALTDWNNEIKQRAQNKNYYTEKELLNIAKQVIDGLAFLQQKNIAHRDIKPQNILIFPNNVYKIADLGEMIDDIKNFENQLTIRGSSIFLSPALKDGLKYNKGGVRHNAYKSDVFSLGYCFLYAMSLSMEILEKAREFWGGNKDYKHIEIDIKKYIGNDRYTNKFIDFIGKMILEDENQREDFFGLKKELELFSE